MSKYTLHFKYQAVLHYLHIRSQQRTADHYGISRTHLRRWIDELMKQIDDYMDYYNRKRCSLKLKKLSPVAYRTQLAQSA